MTDFATKEDVQKLAGAIESALRHAVSGHAATSFRSRFDALTPKPPRPELPTPEDYRTYAAMGVVGLSYAGNEKMNALLAGIASGEIEVPKWGDE